MMTAFKMLLFPRHCCVLLCVLRFWVGVIVVYCLYCCVYWSEGGRTNWWILPRRGSSSSQWEAAAVWIKEIFSEISSKISSEIYQKIFSDISWEVFLKNIATGLWQRNDTKLFLGVQYKRISVIFSTIIAPDPHRNSGFRPWVWIKIFIVRIGT